MRAFCSTRINHTELFYYTSVRVLRAKKVQVSKMWRNVHEKGGELLTNDIPLPDTSGRVCFQGCRGHDSALTFLVDTEVIWAGSGVHLIGLKGNLKCSVALL